MIRATKVVAVVARHRGATVVVTTLMEAVAVVTVAATTIIAAIAASARATTTTTVAVTVATTVLLLALPLGTRLRLRNQPTQATPVMATTVAMPRRLAWELLRDCRAHLDSVRRQVFPVRWLV